MLGGGGLVSKRSFKEKKSQKRKRGIIKAMLVTIVEVPLAILCRTISEGRHMLF